MFATMHQAAAWVLAELIRIMADLLNRNSRIEEDLIEVPQIGLYRIQRKTGNP
jgi:hypothetical protein